MQWEHGSDYMAGSVSLGQLVNSLGLTAADVVALSGISRSSVSRLWSDARWLDKASGNVSNALRAAIPGLDRYARQYGDMAALQRAAEQCYRAGVEVDQPSVLKHWHEGRRASELVPALLAAAALVKGGDVAFHALARCWGHAANRAVDGIFLSPSAGGVIVDPEHVIAGAERLQSRTHGDGPVEMIGRGIALHKLAKHVGVVHDPHNRPRWTSLPHAFRYRSTVIGQIFATGDLDAIGAYQRRLFREPVLQWNEVWSLASYSYDMSRNSPERLPVAPGQLRRTAAQVLVDLERRSPAYKRYLLMCAIPTILEADPRFGGLDKHLAATLVTHLDTDPAARTATAALRRRVHMPSPRR